MRKVHRAALVAAMSAGMLAATAAGSAQAACVLAGGEGVGLVPDVAKFMATAALGNNIKNGGYTASGKIRQVCKTDVVWTTCVSRQRACK